MVRCEFYLEREGKFYGCNKEARRILRCSDVCTTHGSLLSTDNKKRVEKGLDIPLSFECIVKLGPTAKSICDIEIDKPQPLIRENDNTNLEYEVNE